jgi:ribosomal protein S14
MQNPTVFDLTFRSQITDLRRRKKYALKELNSRVLKAILEKEPQMFNNINQGENLSALLANSYSQVRILAENRLQNLKQNTRTRIRNRCVISGRSSTLKKFRLSRIAFRELAGSGKLLGVSKRLHK